MKIAILDTNNFENFPVGGQFSSIKNFMKYIKEKEGNYNNFLFIGITTNKTDVLGKKKKIKLHELEIDFLPVAYISQSENAVTQSLRKSFLKGILKFKKEIKKEHIDLFYIQSFEVVVPLVFIDSKAKRIFFSHGNFFHISNHLRFGKNLIVLKVIRLLMILTLKLSDKVFVLDNYTYKQYSKYVKSSKLYKVNNSIDDEIFNYKVSDQLINNRITYVGRLSKNKGIANIITSLKYIGKDISLHIVGAGECYEELKEIVSKNNLSNRVRFVGKIFGQELVQEYANSDILIMNSQTEGTPMVILEAQAMSLPIISTPVGNIPEIIKEGVNGEFTDGRSEIIAEKVKRIYENINYYRINSRTLIKKYSYKNVNQEILNIILN